MVRTSMDILKSPYSNIKVACLSFSSIADDSPQSLAPGVSAIVSQDI